MAPLGEIATGDEPGVIRLPALVKGELLWPGIVSFDTLVAAADAAGPRPGSRPMAFRHQELQVLREPAAGGERPWRFLVFPRPAPERLLETDLPELSRTLHALPVRDVLDYAAGLRDVLTAGRASVAEALARVGAGAFVDPRLAALTFELLPSLLDPGALGEAVDRELGGDGRPGRAFLDGWVDLPLAPTRGMTARLADAVLGPRPGPALKPSVRAVPTRQLHVTAGNSPLVPLVSFLRGLLTKGACVVKSPAEACLTGAIVAAGMHALDPGHPITRHTSLLYWPGGDRDMEEVLLAPGAFDRVVVWGSAETVASVRRRTPLTRTVAFNPRYGVSLIGREALDGRVEEAAARATVDTLIWEQQACNASLVHYVEADDDGAIGYARALAGSLARWDAHRRRPPPRAAQGRVRLLRRGEWLNGVWFENTLAGELHSAVVYMRGAVDLALHPMARLVVVRRVDRLDQVAGLLTSAVAAAGLFPDAAVPRLRDALTAAGVSNVFPLGECELGYPGIPHDGMRVLSELVDWGSSVTAPHEP
jgi:hypothetical protein